MDNNLVLISHPPQFKEGVRILMRTLRNKDKGGLSSGDRVAEKIVSTNSEEFDEAMDRLLAKRKGKERIYSTIDMRNMEKAIRNFKYAQLDADYFDAESKESFYIDIYNRWISALQSPQSREGTLFLVDIDNNEGGDVQKVVDECWKHPEIKMVDEYDTKNGHHIILQPFNPSLVSFEVKKNAMMLWAYEK